MREREKGKAQINTPKRLAKKCESIRRSPHRIKSQHPNFTWATRVFHDEINSEFES